MNDEQKNALSDYVLKWAKEKDISSESDLYESFQSDWFQEDINDFAEEVLRVGGIIK